jgi:polyisoprenoid-binding protein YceI
MNRGFFSLAGALLLLAGIATPIQAETYSIDPAHSGVNFKISHIGLSWIFGRFNNYTGTFTIDPDDAGKCSFEMKINTESIDTNNTMRDNHLRSPDFFNAKQFPAISFESTGVKAIKDGYEVTGNLTMHGTTKPVTLTLVGGKKAEFPKGVQRTGYSTDLTLKRSDFGVGKAQFGNALGEDVHIAISFEGTKKK